LRHDRTQPVTDVQCPPSPRACSHNTGSQTMGSGTTVTWCGGAAGSPVVVVVVVFVKRVVGAGGDRGRWQLQGPALCEICHPRQGPARGKMRGCVRGGGGVAGRGREEFG
jgi:hypothetical protein